MGVDAALYTTLHHKGDGGHYKSGARKCPNPCRLGYPYPYRAFSALLIDEDHANPPVCHVLTCYERDQIQNKKHYRKN